jgi:hypothetical protein
VNGNASAFQSDHTGSKTPPSKSKSAKSQGSNRTIPSPSKVCSVELMREAFKGLLLFDSASHSQ